MFRHPYTILLVCLFVQNFTKIPHRIKVSNNVDHEVIEEKYKEKPEYDKNKNKKSFSCIILTSGNLKTDNTESGSQTILMKNGNSNRSKQRYKKYSKNNFILFEKLLGHCHVCHSSLNRMKTTIYCDGINNNKNKHCYK